MSKFRFEDLEIWKLAIEILDMCMEISEKLEKLHLYRFAEQLRAAGLSISNNIAEGSGSNYYKEFKLFLKYSRRSSFEVANIVIYLIHKKMISENWREKLIDKLEIFSKKNITFQRTLR
ncbi:MAG: four helix bundle protein [Candidatus Cloacimonetes bacterium]|nr:four helix bundle protein [Candidatus Cloacimonadota bacterium]MCF7813617.1 four helix bundle protein [Candidatus Cloacimonadota bacterium]MCF7867933.1 four helix bundle protein [Candidatus Cloacimonadota bacterium]MCF7882874.1 four helix bundle protein [Candidatus Cloacimonadota bacterium]